MKNIIISSCGNTAYIRQERNEKGRYDWRISKGATCLKQGASVSVLLAKISALNAMFFMAKRENCAQLKKIKRILDEMVENHGHI